MQQSLVDTLHAGDVLQVIRKTAPKELSRQLDPVIELAAGIPAFSGNILEFHFGRAHWFDFSARINRQYDQELLADEELIGGFTGEPCKTLIDRHKKNFRFGIDNLWFEYDFPFATVPALFFDLYRNQGFPYDQCLKDLTTIAARFNHPVHAELEEFFTRLKQAGLEIVHYGMMFSRKSDSVRAAIPVAGPDRLLETLRVIGWAGDYNLVREIQTAYLHPGQRIGLAIDFDRQVGQRLGIEVFETAPLALAAKLQANRICTQDELDVMTSWIEKIDIDHADAQALSWMHNRTITTLHKRISHFKFCIDRSCVAAKAYLYYCF